MGNFHDFGGAIAWANKDAGTKELKKLSLNLSLVKQTSVDFFRNLPSHYEIVTRFIKVIYFSLKTSLETCQISSSTVLFLTLYASKKSPHTHNTAFPRRKNAAK